MRSLWAAISISFLLLFLAGCTPGINYDTSPFELPVGNIQVSFSVTADMRDYAGSNMLYFRGACERIATGDAGDFMLSPGDIDPPDLVYADIQKYIGIDYPWYPVVGNHEAETNYSFDYGDVHFTVINEYYNGTSAMATDGDVPDTLRTWLDDDLSDTPQPIIFVIGHEPAFPQPDEESGRLRHEDDSLNAHEVNRDLFWQTLVDRGVTAYMCGHTHNYSVYRQNGVWQIDVGHARGFGDTGSRITFVMFYVMDDRSVWYYPYRLNLSTHNYEPGIPEKIKG